MQNFVEIGGTVDEKAINPFLKMVVVCQGYRSHRIIGGWFLVHRLGLATVNLYTKYVYSLQRYERR